MASSLTNWGAGRFLAYSMGVVTPPANIYCALVSQDPGSSADGTSLAAIEPPSGTGYARVSVPLNSSNWTDPTNNRYSVNVNAITFPTPTGTWGEINHFVLCDSLTGGNVYLYGEFDLPAVVTPSYAFVVPPGGLIVAFAAQQPSIVVV